MSFLRGFWRGKRGRALYRPYELAVLDALKAALSVEARELIDRQIDGTRRIQRLFNTLQQYPSRGRTPTWEPSIALVNRSRDLKVATVGLRGPAGEGKATVTAVDGHLFSVAFLPDAAQLGDPDSIAVTTVTIHADPMLPDDGSATEARLAALDPDLRAELQQAWAGKVGVDAGLLAPGDTYEVDLADGTWLMLAQLDDTTFLMARSDPSGPGIRRFHPSGDPVDDYPTLTAALAAVGDTQAM
jgi:hypothetical protein